MDWFQTLATYLGLPVVVSTIVIFLGKEIIKQFSNRSLEAAKAKIKDEYETQITTYKQQLTKELEDHKKELDILKKEHEVRFSKLHEDRVSVIKSLYVQLVDLRFQMGDLALKRSHEEHLLITYDADLKTSISDGILKLGNEFSRSKILFSKNVAEQISSVLNKLRTSFFEISMSQDGKSLLSSKKRKESDLVSSPVFIGEIISELNLGIDSLEDEFRGLLGERSL